VTVCLVCLATASLARADTLRLEPATVRPAAQEGMAPVTANGSLVPGARIRVWLEGPDSERVVGELTAIDSEVLQLSRGHKRKPTIIRRTSIQKVEVAVGKRPLTKDGALLGGALVGIPAVAVGIVLGGLVNFECEDNCHHVAPMMVGGALLVGTIGAGTGALVGSLIGSTMETDRWQAATGPRISGRLLPGPRTGLRAELSIRF
jgi:hypothetical protein